MQSFCPIYKEASELRPWKTSKNANSGLIFEKFGDAWQWENENRQSAKFDKGNYEKEGSGDWLKNFTSTSKKHGDSSQLAEAAERQHRLIASLGGCTVMLENDSRFVTGMGRQHPLENGFSWHHTLGVPFLPGTSLKGMLRTWMRECVGDWDDKDGFREDDRIKDLFGVMDAVGDLIMFDMIPLKPVELVREIMTPHYGPYYQDKNGATLPGDWHSPVPIPYLAVSSNQTWQLGIAPRLKSGTTTSGATIEIDNVVDQLVEGLKFLGVGAKTTSGMGRFERRIDLEKKSAARREQTTAKREAEQKVRESDDKLPADILVIVKLERDGKWLASENSTPFLDGMDLFLKNNASPSKQVIEWVRDNIIESGQGRFNNWKGIWENPEAVKKGKKGKKGSPKFDGRKKELVLKLKALFESAKS